MHGKSEFPIDRHRSLIDTFRKTSQFEKIKANHKTEKQREREKERERERERERRVPRFMLRFRRKPYVAHSLSLIDLLNLRA